MTTYYLHTLDGKPAFFNGEYIHFSNGERGGQLATSLQQIRREQELSNALYGYRDDDLERYGYVRVRVTTPQGTDK